MRISDAIGVFVDVDRGVTSDGDDSDAPPASRSGASRR